MISITTKEYHSRIPHVSIIHQQNFIFAFGLQMEPFRTVYHLIVYLSFLK